MAQVSARVLEGGERFWSYQDFPEFSPAAVLQALSRLARRGVLRRVRKGLYYRPRMTVVGPSRVAESDLIRHLLQQPVHPTGTTAASLLGLTTQNPARAEYATTAARPPRDLRHTKLVGGRPASRRHLTEREGAVLELLRTRAAESEASPADTVCRLLAVLREGDTFARLAAAARDEPPRVRALLGALGQEMGADPRLLRQLRESLRPASRFDFGVFRVLPSAKEWQAR